jgi:hypothetical protein
VEVAGSNPAAPTINLLESNDYGVTLGWTQGVKVLRVLRPFDHLKTWQEHLDQLGIGHRFLTHGSDSAKAFPALYRLSVEGLSMERSCLLYGGIDSKTPAGASTGCALS